MSCGKKALLVMLLTSLLGLWGCTQGGGSSTTSARLRELEARSARLEDDYKTAAAARDQARKKVTALEDQRAQLAQQVEQLLKVAKDRDELRTQLTARVAEREALQANLVQFSRDLQNLATKLEQAASGSAAPLLSAPPQPAPPVSPAS
jgi:chromosome segregation ATPase